MFQLFRKKGFCLIVLTILAARVSAEDVSQQPVRDWKTSVYGGFDYATGNTEEKAYIYGGEFEKRNDAVYRYKLKADGKYRETDGTVSDSKAEASGEMRRMLNDRWFVSGTLSALHDDLKDISYRVKVGPGLGRYFTDSEALTADVSTGLLYVREKTPDGESGYLAWRLSQWFDWRATDSLRWWFGTELFVDTSDTADWLLTFKTGIDNKINSHFSLILVVVNEYDSRPEDDNIKQNDFEVSAGLRYTF
jgi:putative salt-induced outer membrane protein YdiY